MRKTHKFQVVSKSGLDYPLVPCPQLPSIVNTEVGEEVIADMNSISRTGSHSSLFAFPRNTLAME
eukprot:4385530-Amphidinium_carterae.1